MKQVKLLLLVLMLPLLSTAQEKWGGGLFLGMSNYWGDLVVPDRPIFDQAGPAFGIMVRNQVSPRFGLRGSLNYAKLEGDDANYSNNVERGAKFSYGLIELGVLGEYDFLGKKRYNGSTFHRILSPYLLGGVAVSFGDPKTQTVTPRMIMVQLI
ncbi:MAG: hypothetical protein IPM82_00240 [Saprospiraceae bacterium]|nr:hypothetical protein [Saprospiraceae bacterium]